MAGALPEDVSGGTPVTAPGSSSASASPPGGFSVEGQGRRATLAAERYTPDLLQDFLCDLEQTRRSVEVWHLLVNLGRRLDLPFVDFISAPTLSNWRHTTYIRTSYDSSWLSKVNQDPDLAKWSYFRTHAMRHLTPIAVGIEFLEDFHNVPEARVKVLREAARRGMRAGFCVPLRVSAPPKAALLTFSGDHSRRQMIAILRAHGWTLHTAALTAFQRYDSLFAQEFSERNQITPKQQELLEMIGRGLQDKQIADALGITVSAVRQRMQLLVQRTGLSSRTELAALAMRIGILPDPLAEPAGREVATVVEMGGGRHRSPLR